MSSRRLLLMLLWFAAWPVVAWLLLTPKLDIPSGHDKLGHFAIYLVLSSLPLSFCVDQRGLALVAALTLGLGAALEYAQSFVPGRSFELADLAANGVGTLTGYAIAAMLMVFAARRAAPGAVLPRARAGRSGA
jgi:VanZ family protein